MASLRGPLRLRANILNGLMGSPHHAALAPRAIASFSTRTVLLNKDTAPQNQQKKDPGYWKYDLSFKTQITKTVFFVFLGAVGAVEGWTWYREIRGWWRGVPDDGEEI